MKTKVMIKHKFEDQEDTITTQDKDAAADAAADAVIPATQPHGGAAAAVGRVERPLPVVLPPALGARALQASGLQGVVGRMLGPQADADSTRDHIWNPTHLV
jgi:hypothetical protein